MIRPRVKHLQHKAAQQEAEADSQNDAQGAWDEERVVKDEFTDTGCTGVIHLYRRNQSRVGRQNEQAGNGGEGSDCVSGETFSASAIGISAFAVAA